MNFQMISGQGQAIRLLQNGLRSGNYSHAYIFHGPPGTGKKAAAMAFARALLCEQQSDDSCGACIECRKMDNGNHTAIQTIVPDGASVKIEQIRELQKQFAYRNTSTSAVQLYIIHEAEKMTVNAANSLLKFLEEPNSRVVAILITHNGQALLPTIRSRAQSVPFVPLAPQQMAPLLIAEGLSSPLVQAAVHLTSGIEAAKELAQVNWFAEIRNLMIQLAKECSGDIHSALLMVQQKLTKSELTEHLDTLLDLFVLWFTDMVHMQTDRKQRIVFIDQQEYIMKIAFSRDLGEWVSCIQKAMEVRNRLRAHVNAQLALDSFLVSMERR
ncbi:MAG: DNA polymerase III subunit delta' [Paenibacillaceae bacterium]